MKKYPKLFVFALDGGVQSYILQQVKAGKLPAFARAIDDGCVFDNCRPPYPSITPTCWTSFSTGATPATHGITDQEYHVEGEPFDSVKNGYYGPNMTAQRFWDAAGIKSLILDLPTSGPTDNPNTRLYNCLASRNGADGSMLPSTCDIPDRLYVFDIDAEKLMPRDSSTLTPSGKWRPQLSLKPDIARPGSNGCIILTAQRKNSLENPNNIQPFTWAVKSCDGGIKIAEDEQGIDNGVFASANGWSPVIRRRLSCDFGEREYLFRFKLICGTDEKAFAIYVTAGDDIMENASPADFARRVSEIDEVPNSGIYSRFLTADGALLPVAFESVQFHLDWHKKVIKRELLHDMPDMVICYEGYPDSINHAYRSVFEGVAPADETCKAAAEFAYRRCYEQLDEMLGWAYENVIGPDTTLLIVSDHGAVGFEKTLRPHEALEKAGLCVISPKTDFWGWPLVDVKRSRAVPFGCGYVYVNLKGRDPDGIVEPEDYDRTVYEIIDVLQDSLKSPEDGINALAFAVPNNQASFVGLGGNRCGDVIYGLAGSRIGGFVGGVHACQMPSARSKTGSINALCILSGSKIINGHVDKAIDLYDLAPTLCYVNGWRQPPDSEGAVLFSTLAKE